MWIENNETKVVVKSINGAKTKCMKSYVIPTVELDPKILVLHCGTNDMKRKVEANIIANVIIDLALSMKNHKTKL